MSADDRPRLALVPGHGAPSDSEARGPGSGGRNNLDAAMRSRAAAIDWAAVAPYLAEDEERRREARAVREAGSS